MSNVCEHGYLTRKCPHCENAELEAKIQATEADNAKHLEAVDHYRTKVQELEDFLRRIYACKDATCDQCAAEIEAHLSTEDGSSREPEGVVEAPLVDGPRRAAVGTDQGDADTYFNEWQFAHQVAEERADRIDRLQAEVARLLDVGADAFHEVNTLHAAKDAMETDLIYVTSQMDEHPDGYEGACWCRSCCSYATDDGEGKP